MRYVVTFMDRSSRRVDEDAGKTFMQAMTKKEPVMYRGAMYAGHSIVSVKPLHQHEQERKEEAQEFGAFRCSYGRVHANKRDCVCRESRYEKVLNQHEEQLLLEMDNSERGILPVKEQQRIAEARFLGIPEA